MIKILFMTANPEGTTALRLDEEIRSINEQIRAAQHRASFRIVQERAVRTTDIISHLRRHKPQVVHFSGHGSDYGEIILEDQNGKSSAVTSDALEDLFRQLKYNIRCVVLNACFSKNQAKAISKSIECVVGMGTVVTDRAAILFASAFYQTLGFGDSLQEAFDRGCLQIAIERLGEENTPKMLHKRGVDPGSIRLVDKTSKPPKPSAKSIRASTKSAPEPEDCRTSIEPLIAELLPAHLQKSFECSECTAVVNDDEAGLSLITALIEKKAANTICVIGRGTQLVEAQTSHYVRAVAGAILRGVEYKRILLLDPNLPQNGLMWLLLLERFLKSPRWRDAVHLYVVRMDLTNIALQFQIIDNKYLHRVVRSYAPGETGASPHAQSIFAISPHGEVSQCDNIHQSRLSQSGERHDHSRVAKLLCEILHNLDCKQQDITYHWRLVLDVIDFLDGLKIQDIPPRGIKFVGSLMPCTFTHQASERFIKSVNESDGAKNERLVTLPFRRLEDAIKQFIEGRLDYVCVPIGNSHVDNLTPPTVGESLFDSLQNDYDKIFEVELPVKFVLAGVYQKPAKWRSLVAVEAAYLQIRDALPRSVGKLPRYEEEVESNYHAAWLAKNDIMLIAVTTSEAAKHLNLCTYSDLNPNSEKNCTKFAVYSHPAL